MRSRQKMTMVATVASTEAQRETAREVEREVFGAWFGATAEELAVEFQPYDDSSIFFLAHPADDPDDVVAASRLVPPGPAGNKTLHHVAAEPWLADGVGLAEQAGVDLDRTWDVATLVARPRGQASGASGALFAEMLAYLPGRGADWWTSLVDLSVLPLTRAAGMPCQPLPTLTARPFLGSPASIPVYGAVADVRLSGRGRGAGVPEQGVPRHDAVAAVPGDQVPGDQVPGDHVGAEDVPEQRSP